MSEIVRFRGGDGSQMLVEVDTSALDDGDASDVGLVLKTRSPGQVAEATTALEDSLSSIEGASVAMLSTIEDLRKRDAGLELSEVALELALSFAVEGGVVVAKGKAGATASVTLTWRSGSEA